jgi:hypothetical protein
MGNLYIRHCKDSSVLDSSRTDELAFSEFCVSVAGYRPSGPIRTPLFTPSYSTPTLHILGRTDVVVVEERSNQLIEVSTKQRVEYHPGGVSAFVCTCRFRDLLNVVHVKDTLFRLKSSGEIFSGLGCLTRRRKSLRRYLQHRANNRLEYNPPFAGCDST